MCYFRINLNTLLPSLQQLIKQCGMAFMTLLTTPKGPYPLGDFGACDRPYNRPQTASYSADPSVNHPMGMAYQIGQLANHRQGTGIARRLVDGQLISSMFDISPTTGRLVMALALRPVAR